MQIRRSARLPLAVALFIALSGACGGDDDDGAVPAEYQTVPGPNVPQPPAQRSLEAEGDVAITPEVGEVASVTLLAKVEGPSAFAGSESGFTLEMACGQTVADLHVELYFSHGTELVRVELENNRWTVSTRSAEVVPSRPASADAGATDADAGEDGGDASAPPPADPDPEFVNGVGFPGTDGRREVFVTLLANGVRYDIRATIPWLASNAPPTCQELRPGTGTKGSSGGGCGGGSGSSRRSSGGDWD